MRMATESIHKGHRERLKQRFLEEGLDNFTDIQVLEMLLFYAIPRSDTTPIAHALLDRFGSLAQVLEADVEALTSVIDRVSVVSEKSKGIKLSLSKGMLQVTAAASDEGSAEDEMEVNYDADGLEIGFNYRYLLDILAQIKSENMRMSLLDGISPVIVESVADASALFVLMPMRV